FPHAVAVTQSPQQFDRVVAVRVPAKTNTDPRSELSERAPEPMADADIPAAIETLFASDKAADAEMSRLLLRRWADKDAPAAARWTAEHADRPFYGEALQQVAVAWANTDLASAAGWIKGLPETESKQSAVLSLASEASRSQPTTALDVLSTLAPTPERDDVLAHAVSEWAVA